MGINIFAYRLLGIKDDKSDPIGISKYWETESVDFDSLRRSGDREFINEDSFGWSELIEDDKNWSENYIRPINIAEAKRWVKENIYEGNQPRLLSILDKMEQDKMIYFTVSY